MPANNVVWTPSMERMLLQLLEENVSYADIADVISHDFKVYVTKNACIGKGRRMQVALRMPARKGRPCLKRKSPSPSLGRSLPRRKKRRADANRQLRRNQRLLRQSHHKMTLMQLRSNSCRWPEGEHPNILFCGAVQADGSSYCPTHAVIACPGFGRAR